MVRDLFEQLFFSKSKQNGKLPLPIALSLVPYRERVHLYAREKNIYLHNYVVGYNKGGPVT